MRLGIRSIWRNSLGQLLLVFCAAGAVHAAEPSVQVQREGSDVIVNFKGRLQTSASSHGPYTNVIGVRSPYKIPSGDGSLKFWRAVLTDVHTIAAGRNHTVAIREAGRPERPSRPPKGGHGHGKWEDDKDDDKRDDAKWDHDRKRDGKGRRKGGTLWAWGQNDSGQLGVGTTNDARHPVQVGTNANWLVVESGPDAAHTLALRTDGTLWAWGDNQYGQLGNGTTNNASQPLQVGMTARWRAISAGRSHTVAVRADGTLWAWGRNQDGQLGIGTTNDSLEPVQIGTDKNWRSVAAGGEVLRAYTVAVRADGTLWGWGNNRFGQLGLEDRTGTTQPVQAGTESRWQTVSVGWVHTVAMREDGTLQSWGHTGFGQLGEEITLTNENWQAVATGGFHTMALREDGVLWAWGRNDSGQLGVGVYFPIHPLVNYVFGTIKAWPVDTNMTWTAVAAGASHTVGLREDGTVWTWGDNHFGQLGHEPVASSGQPAQIGTNTNWRTLSSGQYSTLGLRADGALWGWGNNRVGQLGFGVLVNANKPRQVEGDATWREFSAGVNHTLAVRSDGTLWAWGGNGSGQLGIGWDTIRYGGVVPPPYGPYGTNRPVQVGTDSNWRSVSAGNGYTHAIRNDGTLWACGWNGGGQLGDGTYINTNLLVQVGVDTNWRMISARGHTAALRTDGTLWTWGNNYNGELGIGTFERTSPSGTNQPVQVGSDANWANVVAGEGYTLALRNDGTLWAWGGNRNGRLGIGTTNDVNRPVQIGTDTNWRSIAASETHSAAVRADGSLWVWGANASGQLGDGTTNSVAQPMRVGTDTDWRAVSVGGWGFYGTGFTAALRADGSLWAWGDNEWGQIAQPVPWLPNRVPGRHWGLLND